MGSWEYNEDITEQKRTMEALRESETKYRNLFDNAEIGMFRTELDCSKNLGVNEKFLRIFDGHVKIYTDILH